MLQGCTYGMQKLAAAGIDCHGPRQGASVFFAHALLIALTAAREAEQYAELGLAKFEHCGLRCRFHCRARGDAAGEAAAVSGNRHGGGHGNAKLAGDIKQPGRALPAATAKLAHAGGDRPSGELLQSKRPASAPGDPPLRGRVPLHQFEQSAQGSVCKSLASRRAGTERGGGVKQWARVGSSQHPISRYETPLTAAQRAARQPIERRLAIDTGGIEVSNHQVSQGRRDSSSVSVIKRSPLDDIADMLNL